MTSERYYQPELRNLYAPQNRIIVRTDEVDGECRIVDQIGGVCRDRAIDSDRDTDAGFRTMRARGGVENASIEDIDDDGPFAKVRPKPGDVQCIEFHTYMREVFYWSTDVPLRSPAQA